MKKMFCAVAMLLLGSSLAFGQDTVTATFVKFENGQLTVRVRGKERGKGEEKTYKVAPNVKVTQGKFDREARKFVAGEALEGGFNNEIFKKAQATGDDEKKGKGGRFGRGRGGVTLRLTIENDQVTAASVGGGLGGGAGGFGDRFKRKKQDS